MSVGRLESVTVTDDLRGASRVIRFVATRDLEVVHSPLSLSLAKIPEISLWMLRQVSPP